MHDFLPGVPSDLILERLSKAPGNELKSGKFDSPESSAALAANALGWFTERPTLFPQLPGGMGATKSVTIEVEMRFPWAGGKHPWLDAAIETDSFLIGIESKRYEPFRPAKKNDFAESYDRNVWGDNMRSFTSLRRTHANGARRFSALDDVQLIKHAYGLRTEGQRRGLRPVLLYLYAEPATWANGRAMDPAKIAAHRADIKLFAEGVVGDEVAFVAMSWAELLALWGRGKMPVAEHAARVAERFNLS